jgi:hypothetical protein
MSRLGLLLLAACSEDARIVGATTGRVRPDAGVPANGGSGTPGKAPEAGVLEDAGPAPVSSCGPPSGRSTCDAQSGWPCDVAAGWTCDFSRLLGGFDCFSPPNPVPFCGACSVAEGLTCSAGFTCGLSGWCERICCSDSDCGTGECVLGSFSDPLVAGFGYCREEGVLTCGSDSSSPVGAMFPTWDASASTADASAPSTPPDASASSAPSDAAVP